MSESVGYLSGCRKWWASLDREEKEAILRLGVGMIALYASFRVQKYMMSMMVNPKYARQKSSALRILIAVGIEKTAARKLLRNLNEHEIQVLQDLVTNQTDMNNLDEIAGLQNAKNVLNRNLRVAREIKKEEKYAHLVNITPGILLYGPPGCGKTMMARAVAKEMGFRFFVVKPSVVNNKWVGESEKTIQAIFSLAKKLAPMVIFIDEIEVLLGSRGSSSHSDFKDTKIAEFLTAWDGFDKTPSATIVIGATNRKEMLDEAILRRLPIKIEIPMPDRGSRQTIFETKLTQEGVKLEAEIEKYINLTDNWNASKITNFLESVLTFAVQEAFENESKAKTETEKMEKETSVSDAVSNDNIQKPTGRPIVIRVLNSLSRLWSKSPLEETVSDDEPDSFVTITESHLSAAFEQFSTDENPNLRSIYT